MEKLLKTQEPIRWILAIFEPVKDEVPVTMNYKEELISNAVSRMDCFQKENIVEPENAEIKLGDSGYYIEPEEMGTHMVFESVLAKVKQAVSAGDSEVSLTDEDYVNPEYTSESDLVTETMDRINLLDTAFEINSSL